MGATRAEWNHLRITLPRETHLSLVTWMPTLAVRLEPEATLDSKKFRRRYELMFA